MNEQSVHQPPPLLPLGQIADDNLANCLEQTIADEEIRRADELSQLACTHGGIEELTGLEQFKELERLNLSHNALASITVLYELPELEDLRLEGNPDLSCGELQTLSSLRGNQLTIATPEHCQ